MRSSPAIAALVVLALIGCGGGGSKSPARSAAQEAALRAIETVIDVNRKGSSGPVPADGLRRARAFRAKGHVPTRSADDYDEDYRLWKTEETSGLTTTVYYWRDSAATKPAGTRVIVKSAEEYPYTETIEETITAGPAKGGHWTSLAHYASSDVWDSVDDYSSADGTSMHITEERREDGTHIEALESAQGELFFRYSNLERPDGSSTRSVTTPTFEASAEWQSDQSAEGAVVAKDPKSSATFSASADGTVVVRYADGDVETFATEE